MMPEMDGFSVATWMKEDADLGDCHTIILSSAAKAGDVEQCRRLGVARYMQKPIVPSDLLATILRVTGTGYAEKTSQFSPVRESTREYRKLKILLAEDGEVNQQVAIGLLTQQGHQVIVASDGVEAVNALDDQMFDLVLMDVQMPNMDGIEATKIIRQKEQATDRHTPIVAMTAGAMKGDEERCLGSGMDSYLSKPINPKMLYEVIEQCADEQVIGPSIHPQHDQVEGQIAADDAMGLAKRDAPQKRDLTEDPDVAEILSVIDVQAARELCHGNEDKLRMLAETLMGESADLMRKAREAVDARDAELIRRCAHSLKGAASVFAATGVVETALCLEMIAAEKKLDDIETPFAKLDHEVARLTLALKSLISAE